MGKSGKVGATRSWAWLLYVAVGVVAVALVGGALLYANGKKAAPVAAPPAASGYAIPVGSGPVSVQVYEDFQCPACGQAEKAIGASLQKLAADGKVTLNYHMMSFLGPESVRAANAAFCASDVSLFEQFHNALYANQPAEHSGGYTNADLVATGTSLGAPASFGDCVNAGTYNGFADKVTADGMAAGVTSTPTFMVNGQKVTVSKSWQEVLDAIDAAAGVSPSAVPQASQAPTSTVVSPSPATS